MAEQTPQTNPEDASAQGVPRKPAQDVAVSNPSVGTAAVKKSKTEIQMEAIRAFLKTYAEKMATNKAVDPLLGAEMQLGLWDSCIKRILQMRGSDFHQAYDEFLQFVQQHRSSLFSERYAYRFQDKLVTMPQTDRVALERVLTLAMMTCNPATRQQVLARYDWTHLRRALQPYGVDELLTEYYSVI